MAERKLTRKELAVQLAYSYAAYEREVGDHCQRDPQLAERLDRPREQGGVGLQSVADFIVRPAQNYAAQGRVLRVRYLDAKQLAELAKLVVQALPKMRRDLDEFEGPSSLAQVRKRKSTRRRRVSVLAAS